MTARLPDFLIIGAAKAGTTTLYRWLGNQPDVWLPSMKEPHYFSRPERWGRGRRWYESLFDAAPGSVLVGEASASYTSPGCSAVAARRAVELLPRSTLVYLVRHPVDRLRSHYLHDVLKGRSPGPFLEVVSESGNPYVGHSAYFSCIEPWLQSFPPEQLCVVRAEDLWAHPNPGWDRVLDHLGIRTRPAPKAVYNAVGDTRRYTRLGNRARSSGLLAGAANLPAPVRSIGKRFLTRRPDEALSADGPLPGQVMDQLEREASALAEAIGLDQALWDLRETDE